jgi:hypothetical protein
MKKERIGYKKEEDTQYTNIMFFLGRRKKRCLGFSSNGSSSLYFITIVISPMRICFIFKHKLKRNMVDV